MNFKKVHPDFGIEINDIKINKINHEGIIEILNLFEEYSLIVLKNQIRKVLEKKFRLVLPKLEKRSEMRLLQDSLFLESENLNKWKCNFL